VSDLILLCFHELLIVVFLAIHLEHNVDVIRGDKEPLAVILGNSLLNIVVDHYFFKVCLVVSPVSRRFHGERFWEEQSQVQFGGVFIERKFDQLIVSLVQ
jgi:hypothetical protein